MTREDFIKGYCERSGVTAEWTQSRLIALPCACGESNCNGWVMVENNQDSIKVHSDLYAPKKSEE